MAALTADKSVPEKGVNPRQTHEYPVAASTTIYAGSMLMLNASGYLVPAATGSGFPAVGVALEAVDNSSGANGDENCLFRSGTFEFVLGGGIDQSDVGNDAYIVDDQTVTEVVTSGEIVGKIYEVDGSSCWVHIAGPQL